MVVAPEDPDGVQLVLYLADAPAQAFQQASRRAAASHAERARLNATRAIRAAMANLARANPAPGRHLAATIRTGRYCAYTPDPRPPRLGALTRAIGPGLNAGAPGLNAHPAVRMRTRLDDPTTWKEAPR
jgi:hypothetical protein